AFALSRLTKLGTVGDLKSYAAPALRADEIAKTLVASSETMIADAVSKLDDENPEIMLAGALALTDGEWRYGGFASVKAKITSAIKKAKRDKMVAAMFAQAEGIVRARRLAASDRESLRRQASQAYETVIRRFPQTQADKIARIELAEISPNSRVLRENGPAAQLRVWTDSTGRYSIKATLIKFDEAHVTLRKENGEEVKLPANKLSKKDIEFLETQM
ncbi:MAG: SHD1 domain-containing protein, partial [Planctomycetota bacterium]